ncbi:MAG: helix-turn-helix domain-containing protein, partial [Burkholderiaceae bacterium]
PAGLRQGVGGGVAAFPGTGVMSETREAALDAFLRLVGEKGYAAVALRDVAEAAAMGFAELYGLFPDKVALAAAFMARIDARVLDGVPSCRDPEETARDRLFDTMMRRYDSLKPYRPALRGLRFAAARNPFLALALSPALHCSMACMLEAAAIPADGFFGAARQNGLLAIDYAVSGVFHGDDSFDLSKTMAALDQRLKSAERWAQVFEKYAKNIQPTTLIQGPDSRTS